MKLFLAWRLFLGTLLLLNTSQSVGNRPKVPFKNKKVLKIPVPVPVAVPLLTSVSPLTSTTVRDKRTLVATDISKFLSLAAVLRDNIVNIIGYVLNYPNINLKPNVYSAIGDLYQAARMRRFSTTSILYHIDEFEKIAPQKQLEIILNTVRRNSPIYLKGSIEEVVVAIKNHSLNINSILSAKRQTYINSFAQGIRSEVVENVKKSIVFPNSAFSLAPQTICTHFGNLICNTIGAILIGAISVGPEIISGLLLHAGFNTFSPELSEAVRYMANELNKHPTRFSYGFRGITPMMANDPYDLIYNVMKNIRNDPPDDKLRECANIIMNLLKQPSILSVNPHFIAMSPIVHPVQVDYELLFKQISISEYPKDVVRAKDAVLTAIGKKEINIDRVLKGLIRHDYEKPLDLLLAIIARIKRILTLPNNLTYIINNLYIHVKLKRETTDPGPLDQIYEFTDVALLFNAFRIDEIPTSTREKLEKILTGLSKFRIVWNPIFDAFPPRLHSNPRELAITILQHLINAGKVPDGEIKQLILTILPQFKEILDTGVCPIIYCNNTFDKPLTSHSSSGTLAPLLSSKETTISTRSLMTFTTSKQTPPFPKLPNFSVARMMNPARSLSTFTPRTYIFKRVSSTTSIPKRVSSTTSTPKPVVENLDPASFIPAIYPVDERDMRFSLIMDFIFSPVVLRILRKIGLQRFKTNGLLLKAVLEKALKDREVLENHLLKNALEYYAPKVLTTGKGAQPLTFLNTIEKNIDLYQIFKEAININKLVAEGHQEQLDTLFKFLEDFFEISDNSKLFSNLHFTKKEEFVELVLQKLFTLSSVPQHVKQAVMTVTHYIIKDEVAADSEL